MKDLILMNPLWEYKNDFSLPNYCIFFYRFIKISFFIIFQISTWFQCGKNKLNSRAEMKERRLISAKSVLQDSKLNLLWKFMIAFILKKNLSNATFVINAWARKTSWKFTTESTRVKNHSNVKFARTISAPKLTYANTCLVTLEKPRINAQSVQNPSDTQPP